MADFNSGPASENRFRTPGGSERRNSFSEQHLDRLSDSHSDITDIGCSGPSSILHQSRMVHNPFAFRAGVPTRSMADSTDHKESRPILAPATLVLGRCNNDTETTSNSVSSSFRLKAPILNNPFFKVDNSQATGKKPDSSEVSTTRELSDNNSRNTVQEKNVSLANANRTKECSLRTSSLVLENDSQVATTSNAPSHNFTPQVSWECPIQVDHPSPPVKDNAAASAHSHPPYANSCHNGPPASEGANFVFGQNMNERVTNVQAVFGIANGAAETSFCTGEPVFKGNSHTKEYSSKRDEAEEAGSDTGGKQVKSLTESALEYESRQVKRTYEEVAIVTGEEDESNVLQMNCKLFTYDKGTLSWVEKGRGILRLNDKELEDGSIHSRLVARTQGSLRVVLNTKVWAAMSVDRPSPKSVRLTAMDGDIMRVFLVSGSAKDIDQLFGALDWRITTLKSSEERKAVENTACSILAAASLEPKIGSGSFAPGDEAISSSGTSPASPGGAAASVSGLSNSGITLATPVITGDRLGMKKRRISPPGVDEDEACLGSSSINSRVQERRVDSTDTIDSNSCDDSNLSFASSSTI